MKTKTGFDFFDHIYCINMKSCVARKEHMIKEFEKIKVDKNQYDFIEAVNGNTSKKVEKLLIPRKGSFRSWEAI